MSSIKDQLRKNGEITLPSGKTLKLTERQKKLKKNEPLLLDEKQTRLLLDEYFVQYFVKFEFTPVQKDELLQHCHKQFKTCELLLLPVAFGEEINVRQEDIASCSLDEIRTKYKLDKFYNMHKALEECEKYNKLMWRKYSNLASGKDKFEGIDQMDPVFIKYRTNFENNDYTVENFKYQCEFYNKLIDEFIDKHHLKPPERKRAALIFCWILAFLAIVFWFFCMFAPALLISVGV